MQDDEEDDIHEDEESEGGGDVALLPPDEILEHAREITQEHLDDGVTLGLRGLYYKFIGRGIVSKEELAVKDSKGNTVGGLRFYKRMGALLAAARYDGRLDIDSLADGGREVHEGDATREDIDVAHAHVTAGSWIRSMHSTLMQTARWSRQPKFVSVWAEKDAMTPALKPVCDELGVAFVACKGYPSVSLLRDWLELANFACNGGVEDRGFRIGDMHYRERHVGGTADEAVIIYLGDHDPDGFEIPRSSERGLHMLMDTLDMNLPLRVKRVALTIDQVRRFRLPAFEAKKSSARYKRYKKEHGLEDAWELDALDLRFVRDLVRDEVNLLWNPDLAREQEEAAEERSNELRELIADPAWVSRLFK